MVAVKLYMAVTKDKYELPYAVEQTPSELAKAIGVRPNTVVAAICRGERGYVVVDVDVEDGELLPQRYCRACGCGLGHDAHPQKRFCADCAEKRNEESKRRSHMFRSRMRW